MMEILTAQHQLPHYFTTMLPMRRHLYIHHYARARGGAVGSGAAWDRFPMGSLEYFIDLILLVAI